MTAMVASHDLNMDSNWYPDSGATNHLTNNFNNQFIGFKYRGERQVYDANGSAICLLCEGLSHWPNTSPRTAPWKSLLIQHHPSHYYPTKNMSQSSSPKVLSVVSPSIYPFSHSHQDEAFSTAIYLINRLPTPVLAHVSPLEKLFGLKPNYSSLRSNAVLRHHDDPPSNMGNYETSSSMAPFPIDVPHVINSHPMMTRVAKGFHQTPNIDYTETFSPVVKSVTTRVLLTLALMKGWSIRQLDVNNAFIHGYLHESVFMEQLFVFHVSAALSMVCHLKKALYGLKQALHACSSIVLDELIKSLNSTFALKDLGKLNYFLGIEVSYPEKGGNVSFSI
ncbi:Reverse transcriptase, RNA-dependent DNA polymerase [Cucumis melo var. makuwa]|uniref:Reverse transcriptase, RNA-dependent DNA polymerase n=1 Tax=Cucumis melo var. makuwa TaxID=1194695 RepID=A0A5D3CT89_CUCMM|nr:Reverse transcriptase, RNA-dependent DNA polymerase [Cucumis melo var. makuwa]TYK15147.1 Reverse transcriptase, RNA-dependent DNA polymerase [Cucumis melo var. makuwa]